MIRPEGVLPFADLRSPCHTQPSPGRPAGTRNPGSRRPKARNLPSLISLRTRRAVCSEGDRLTLEGKCFLGGIQTIGIPPNSPGTYLAAIT